MTRLEKEAQKRQQYHHLIKRYKERLNKITAFKKEITLPFPLLYALAQSINPDAVLTNIIVEQQSHPSDKKQRIKIQEKTVVIEGTAHKIQAVSSFIKNMHAAKLLKELTLAKLTKEENKQTKIKNCYHFKISGKLSSSS